MNANQILKSSVVFLCLLFPFYANAADTVQKVSNALSDAGKAIATAANDTEITTKVKALLAVESDIPLSISVKTINGVVELGGKVDTQLQAKKIVQIAENVKGVKQTDSNDLEIAKSEHYFKDAALTMKAKYAIMKMGFDKQIATGNNLQVETTDGVVHIFGNVANKADIKTIKDAVQKIDNVKDVKSNISANLSAA